MKKIPILFEQKEECCGCTACYSICPVSAIDMRADEEGFLYPKIDIEKCFGCFSCLRVCPIRAMDEDKKEEFPDEFNT